MKIEIRPLHEIWKPIDNFPGYEVSSLGRVRGRNIMKQWKCGQGLRYFCIGLRKAGKTHKKNVHVLVAEAFKGQRPKGKEVAHWDGNGHNNREDNLRWATHGENKDDQRRHGTLGRGGVKAERHHKAVLCWEFVEALRKLKYVRGLFTQLAYVLNVNRSSIGRAYTRKMWKRA